MCSTSPPKNSPFQLPMGQTTASPSGLFAPSPQNLFNAGDPKNFPSQQADATQQTGNPSSIGMPTFSDPTKPVNPLRGKASGFGGMPRGGPRFGIMSS